MITISLTIDSHEIEQLTIALESSDIHTRNGPDVAALLDRVHAAARAATKGGTPSPAETPPPPICTCEWRFIKGGSPERVPTPRCPVHGEPPAPAHP